jgi:hypothetical protein
VVVLFEPRYLGQELSKEQCQDLIEQ